MPPYRKTNWIIGAILVAPLMAAASESYARGGSLLKKLLIFVTVSLGIIYLPIILTNLYISLFLLIPISIWPFSWWLTNRNWYKLKDSGEEMNHDVNKKKVALVVLIGLLGVTIIIISIYSIMTCCAPQPHPKGIQKIEVHIYEDWSDIENDKKIYVGDVLIDAEGELSVSILNEGDDASRLREAIADIRSRGSLKTHAEEMKNGKLVMYDIYLSPTDEGYLWPVSSILKMEYFFDTKVVYVK